MLVGHLVLHSTWVQRNVHGIAEPGIIFLMAQKILLFHYYLFTKTPTSEENMYITYICF